MKKKILSLLLALARAASLLTACGGGSKAPAGSYDDKAVPSVDKAVSSDEAGYIWKMHLNSTPDDNAYDMGALFARKVAELTNGRVKVELYGGASLGSTPEVLEGMSAGVADVAVESVGALATFTPLANIEAMPYMFKSYDHFMRVWYSGLGEEIKTAVGDAAGFKLMGAAYRGPRIVTATKEMKTVEDFEGFKLRVPDLEMYIRTWESLGAVPVPMTISKAYPALQQKTIEGQENPMVDSLNYAFDEVCDYWIKTNHIYGCNVVMMDRDYFNGLPSDIREAVIEAAEYAGKEISEAQAEKDARAEAELKSLGKHIIEVDNDAFAEHFKNFAAANYPGLADWVARIAEMAP